MVFYMVVVGGVLSLPLLLPGFYSELGRPTGGTFILFLVYLLLYGSVFYGVALLTAKLVGLLPPLSRSLLTVTLAAGIFGLTFLEVYGASHGGHVEVSVWQLLEGTDPDREYECLHPKQHQDPRC